MGLETSFHIFTMSPFRLLKIKSIVMVFSLKNKDSIFMEFQIIQETGTGLQLFYAYSFRCLMTALFNLGTDYTPLNHNNFQVRSISECRLNGLTLNFQLGNTG